jgi:starch-binding outer membrane protein, SusD/RagB family
MSRTLKAGMITVAAGAVVTLAACGDRLTVPNFQNPTVSSISADPVAAIPLLATGVMRDDRGNMPGYVLGVGILGREAYNYTPTEGRNTTGWLTSDVSNSTSFGGTSLWSGPYFTVRDAFNTLAVIDAAGGTFTDAQKNAMKGLMHTEVALSLLYVINTRDKLGAPVEVYDDPTKLAPFQSRDSVFNFIIGTLNQAATELGAGGTSFPFTLPSGFTGFTTPANFLKFNRALAARVNAYRASLGIAGCGAARSAACYQQALTALSASFMDPTASLSVGVFNVYSAASGDVANSNSNQATTAIVAHAKADSGVLKNAAGTLDARFTAKVIKLSAAKAPPTNVAGVASQWDYSVYALRTDPIAIIRNEELILLRAEARYYTGDQTGALADINLIRTKSGALDARGAFASESDFLDELLYNRRMSLLFEGHRWVDMRRFGRLGQLTIDAPSHVVVNNLPVPQAECLSRAKAAAALAGPGC